MTELLRELEAVVDEIDQIAAVAASGLDRRLMDLTSKLRTRHAEIAEAVKWKSVVMASPRVTLVPLDEAGDGAFIYVSTASGIGPECVPTGEPVCIVLARALVDAHNSAREVGE